MTKRKILKDIVDDIEVKLELGDTVHPWEVDDLLDGFSKKVINIVHRAIDEKIDFDFTEVWNELEHLRDNQL